MTHLSVLDWLSALEPAAQTSRPPLIHESVCRSVFCVLRTSLQVVHYVLRTGQAISARLCSKQLEHVRQHWNRNNQHWLFGRVCFHLATMSSHMWRRWPGIPYIEVNGRNCAITILARPYTNRLLLLGQPPSSAQRPNSSEMRTCGRYARNCMHTKLRFLPPWHYDSSDTLAKCAELLYVDFCGITLRTNHMWHFLYIFLFPTIKKGKNNFSCRFCTLFSKQVIKK